MIFINGNTPSLKNSKVATANGIFPSKTVVKYLRNLGIQHYSSSRKEVKGFVRRENLFLQSVEPLKNDILQVGLPIVLGFHFVRGSKREFDFGNACQIVQDLLVAHDIIPDDSMTYLVPVPFMMNDVWYSYNKTNPGVYLKVLNGIRIT